MAILWPSHTHILQKQWPKLTYTMSISYMAYLVALLVIETPFFSAHFDSLSSQFWGLTCSYLHPITLRRMVKLRSLIGVWRTTSDACVLRTPRNGLIGCHWLNGGITPHTTLPFRKHPSRYCIIKLLHCIYHTYLENLATGR